MNSTISRTFKALCLIAVSVVLTSCGSSSTVDPFRPTRVIGLGDAYNDTANTQSTVRGTTQTVTTVVAQVAALYGSTTVESYASSTYATTADLITQISRLDSLSATTDLVVITAGTKEFMSGTDPTGSTYLNTLKSALDTLKAKGAKHIVIMEVIDLSQMGVGFADPITFNSTVKAGLSGYVDVARYGNMNRPSAFFPGWVTSGVRTPFCASPSILDGCDFTDVGNGTGDVSTYFLADNLHSTPAGNQWLGIQLFNVTGAGWR